MGVSRIERILILAKTYPSPSAKHVETSCVAGITEQGCMRRLYPVPFRLIEEGQQFKKWQWVTLRVEKARADHRPESHKVYIDTLTAGDHIDTSCGWALRRDWLSKIPSFSTMQALDRARIEEKVSLALIKPERILGLEITPARHADWTTEEREKLTQQQMELFSEEAARSQVRELRKVPFDFYYRFECGGPEGTQVVKHKIVDWEAGALFWNCQRSHGDRWQEPFRARLEADLLRKDLTLMMGNQHRFPDQWLVISLIYPPKLVPEQNAQGALF